MGTLISDATPHFFPYWLALWLVQSLPDGNQRGEGPEGLLLRAWLIGANKPSLFLAAAETFKPAYVTVEIGFRAAQFPYMAEEPAENAHHREWEGVRFICVKTCGKKKKGTQTFQ